MIVNTSIWGALQDQANNFVFDCVGSIAPIDGTTGANITGPMSTYSDYTNKKLYINTGTKAVPVWTQVYPFTDITITTPIITHPAISYLAGSFAAAGSAQGDAVAITTGSPANILVTGADGTKGAKLPTAIAGMWYAVKNDDAANNILKVYPAGTNTINALGASNPISMAAKTSCIYMCVANNAWLTIPLLPS